MAQEATKLTGDHLLLLQGVADGYPLPSQHPANDLALGGRFQRAFDEAAKFDTLRAQGSRLILTDAGRAALAPHPDTAVSP